MVPGLRDALRLTGLASYTALAESWCTERGTALLAELLEEFDDFCASLGVVAALSPERAQRLKQALALLADRHDGTSRLASAPPALGISYSSQGPAGRRGNPRPQTLSLSVERTDALSGEGAANSAGPTCRW